MTPEIKALYKPPFKYDGRAYIQDSEYNMVADFKDPDLMPGQGKEFRPRGWGRIGQMPDGARLHDDEFVGSDRSVYGQIGDAVPVPMARWAAEQAVRHLRRAA